jgi:hypothetical protein
MLLVVVLLVAEEVPNPVPVLLVVDEEPNPAPVLLVVELLVPFELPNLVLLVVELE